MMKQFGNIHVIILAAGKGTRMNEGRPSAMPKVLFPLAGKPMISYILGTLDKMGIHKPTLVVGYKAELVKKVFGDKIRYVMQKKRLGTGQAARLAVEDLARIFNLQFSIYNQIPNSNDKNTKQFSNNCVLILQGDDSAFYRAETLEKFIKNHQEKQATLSFLTTRIPGIKDVGRVVRDTHSGVVTVVEKEQMTPAQQKIDEINCGAYLLNFAWAKANLKKIKKHYKSGKEYPLPDIIKIALEQKKKVIGWEIPAKEWIGINLPEQLKRANEIMGCKNPKS